MRLLILFKPGTHLRNDGLHKYIILSQNQIQDGRLVVILVVKKTDVEHVLSHFPDMHLPMLFKLDREIKNNSLHKHVVYFGDQIQDGRLAAILLLKSVPNHFSDMHCPIFFKLGTSTACYGIHMDLTSFCDLFKDGRLVDWRPF